MFGGVEVLPGLKGGDWESFLPDEGDERTKREISWDPRIFDEWKVKAEAWLKNLRFPEEF